jgi:hypothetical protein
MGDTPKLGIPILPVAIALVVGFSIGLAVSIMLDNKSAGVTPPLVIHEPCKDCADKTPAAAVATSNGADDAAE